MLLKDIRDALEAEVLVGEDSLDIEIEMACGANLLDQTGINPGRLPI